MGQWAQELTRVIEATKEYYKRRGRPGWDVDRGRPPSWGASHLLTPFYETRKDQPLLNPSPNRVAIRPLGAVDAQREMTRCEPPPN